MMSEKRFVCIDIGYGDECYITDNGERLSEMEIVDLLNTQQATIQVLERKLKKYAKIGEEQLKQIMELQDLCGESDSENARLRLKSKELQEEIKLLKPTNVEQYEQIVQLQEENEQLKNKLNSDL